MSKSSGRSTCHVCNGTGRIGGHLSSVLASVHHLDGEVVLHREDVAFAADVGLRRASQLMDEWASERLAVDLREYEPPHAVNNYEGQKKAIVVDTDAALKDTPRLNGGGRE